MSVETELDVVAHEEENLFRYIAPDGREMMFRVLLPVHDIHYLTVKVIRDGREIGDTMASSVGTHAPLEVFSLGGLRDVFGKESSSEETRQLLAKEFQAGDRLIFPWGAYPKTESFAQFLEDKGFWVGLISLDPSADAPLGNTASPRL
jgi:hypothetical protein